jgi:negative regulator of flagellin synthesis FlgM
VKIENITKIADIAGGGDAAPSTRFSPRISGFPLTNNRVRVNRQLHDIEPSTPGGAFDIKRVEELKKAISEGRFVIDSEKVADKLLETMGGLLRGKRS